MECTEATLQNGNAVMIGNRMTEAAIKRSEVLSGIEHTEGLASLPAQLSPEDVRLWQTACSVDFEVSLDEIVTVLKVRNAWALRKMHRMTRRASSRALIRVCMACTHEMLLCLHP